MGSSKDGASAAEGGAGTPDSRSAAAFVAGLCARPAARRATPLAAFDPGGYAGAAGLLAGLRGAAPVTVVTGTFIPWAGVPGCETDGPVGTAALAAVLEAAGLAVTVLTDEPCAAVVRACLEVVAPGAHLEAVPVTSTAGEMLAAAGAPVCLVAVERLGPGRDGVTRNMRGVTLDPWTAPLWHLFVEPVSPGGPVPTIGVGDGGNEIGMGNLPAALVGRWIGGGERIHCTVPVDHLLFAGTSNWGCYGLLTTLALTDPDRFGPAAAALLDPASDERLLEAAVDAGAVDGTTGDPTRGVDGVEHADYADLLGALATLARPL